MKWVDDFLNSITMYRLLLYFLIVLAVAGSIFAALGMLPFGYIPFIISTLFVLAVSLISNAVFGSVFEAHTNVESVYISSLILSLIISPATDLHGLIFLGWAATLTTSGKYILAIKKKHIFNPVAIAVVLTAFVLGSSATWWVGTWFMLPFVAVGGALIVRKIQREDLFFSFLITAVVVTALISFVSGTFNLSYLQKIFLDTPIIFFGVIMLTEPLTTPPKKSLRIWYGALVGVLFAPQIHFGSVYSTPELALVVGNIFSYLVSPKEKLLLKLKEKIQLAPNIFDFVFEDHTDFAYVPGEYMEWTLGHEKADERGNRRYFTIASSPTEKNVRIGVRFYNASSTFKKYMFDMTLGSTIAAGQHAGDFVLPDSPMQKLAFIAGGIGVTPFRSQLKYLTDKREARDIVLFYSNKTASEIVYKDVFDEAKRTLGIKTVYTITDREHIPSGWTGHVGRLDANIISSETPDYKERMFYLSGPSSLVNGFRDLLRSMGVSDANIKTDFFPGFM